MVRPPVSAQSVWREISPTTKDRWVAEFALLGSPLLESVDAMYAASGKYSAVVLAFLYREQLHWTYKESPIPHSFNNPLSLAKPDGKPSDGVKRWMKFGSVAYCVREWTRRLNDPTYKPGNVGVYTKDITLGELVADYAPPSENNTGKYLADIISRINAMPVKEGGETVAIVHGHVPHPGYLDRLISKSEGLGWDNLGPRQPKFVVLHRMLGSLWGTDGFFRMPGTNALTDYGVGVAATDGVDNAGVIIRWNDPLGVRAGWASGPVSGAYGDGLAIVNAYGLNAVNRDGVSIEISGFADTPIDAKAFEEIAQLMAYWWDQMRIPHTSAPINPETGISAVIWHQEFTIGTGKECPFKVVMDQTNALIDRATAILKQHQEGTPTTVTTPSPPTPKPPVVYPEGMDKDLATQWFGKVVVNGATFEYDPNGSVSRLWLSEGSKTGVYPALVSVQTFGARTYWRFENALTIWRPNNTEVVRILKSP